MNGAPDVGTRVRLGLDGIGRLLRALRADGRRLVGPTVRDGAIVCAEIGGVEDLPVGWTETQEAGRYRLVRRDDQALFGYAVGPQSWKQFFHLPVLRLWRARRDGTGFQVEREKPGTQRLALIGVRACDLNALAIQDRVLTGGPQVDADYAARRADTFVVAVNCGVAGGTCFCVSMGTGPRASSGFDVALTELLGEAGDEGETGHRFLVEVGSEAGSRVLAAVGVEAATPRDVGAAETVVERTARSMGRSLETHGIRELLYRNLEHPRWDDVAERCLACTNCTMVCPTCFCTSVEDVTDLTGDSAERVRRWDSCFSQEFSYVHGGNVRASHRARYRQWLTHKLATWIDQFGSSGCVGCGRCITWCPVGIDITAEVAAIRQSDGADPSRSD